MNYLSAVLLATLLSTPMAMAVTPDEAQLRYLKEVQWPQAYRENDVALLAAILHPDFVMIDANGGTSTRAAELERLPSSTWPHDNFQFEIQRLDVYHDNTAIITGQGQASGTGANGPYCFTYQSSNVLVRTTKGWQAVASHVSGVQRDCDSARKEG